MGMLLSSMQPEQILKYYLHIIFYGALSFFLVSVTRSSSVSMIIFLAYTLIVEQLMVFGLQHYELNAVADVLPIQLAGKVRGSDTITNGELFVYLGYLAGFIGIGQWLVYKRDL